MWPKILLLIKHTRKKRETQKFDQRNDIEVSHIFFDFFFQEKGGFILIVTKIRDTKLECQNNCSLTNSGIVRRKYCLHTKLNYIFYFDSKQKAKIELYYVVVYFKN